MFGWASQQRSSRSLRYLVGGSAKSYREKTITGADAGHSNLHDSEQVDCEIVKLIWRKH
ncbi:alpha/beta hydrolase [Bifidobacterium xylocopae]|uniref:Alpha/beta hydrolase n=1 Tax=Bifidobacterium xylocopae TaxID=2493119 RepID=A0A366KDM1_9BIFI|nr:hypothetical protein CRD59_02785 [Bifidobacterium xylocopae]